MDRDQALVVPGDADAAREEQEEGRRLVQAAPAEVEDAGVLQEEVALLGEEEVEAREVHLLVVGLHLGEVRMDGAVQHEPRPHFPLRVEADVGLPCRSRASSAPVNAGCLRQADEAVRLHLQVEAGARQAAEADEASRLADALEAAAVARPGRPQRLLVLAAHHPPDVEAPAVRPRLRGITQRAEGDRDLRGPALGHALRAHRPDRAPVRVEGAGLVGDEGVELRAVRVGGEDHGIAPVAEGVEQDGHAVVARELVAVLEAGRLQQLVALPDAGHHAVRLRVAGQHADVEVALVVEDAHLGLLGGRLRPRRARAGGGRRPGRPVPRPPRRGRPSMRSSPASRAALELPAPPAAEPASSRTRRTFTPAGESLLAPARGGAARRRRRHRGRGAAPCRRCRRR